MGETRGLTPTAPAGAQLSGSAKSRARVSTRGSVESGGAGSAHPILQLQNRVGNRAVHRLLDSEASEREAARAADHASGPAAAGVMDRVKPASSPRGVANGGVTAPASVGRALAEPGLPLDASLRHEMERGFGHDFSRVRVHSGASAEQSTRDIGAKAFTTGHDIVFGAGRFAPGTSEGRQLLAHELTHVVQQSMPAPPGAAVVQRDKNDPAKADPAKADPAKSPPAKRDPAREKVEKAMAALQAKYGLGSVTEEDGAKWTVNELARVDRDFAKLAKEDLPLLKGLHLIRSRTLGEKRRGGKTFKIAGRTSGTHVIRLAGDAFNPGSMTILHEVGHLVNNRVAEAMLGRSKPRRALDAANESLTESAQDAAGSASQDVIAFGAALNAITEAGGNLLGSNEDTRAARRTELEDARNQAGLLRYNVVELSKKGDKKAAAWLKVEEKQDRWIEAIEKYLVEKDKANLTPFIDVVNKNNLARRIYRPFTDYVAAHWPAEPKEYFAEAFRAWRTDRAYMKSNMKPLFDFFEKGGHRGDFLAVVETTAPVIYELGKVFKDTMIDRWPSPTK
jgi:hypothetical protein